MPQGWGAPWAVSVGRPAGFLVPGQAEGACNRKPPKPRFVYGLPLCPPPVVGVGATHSKEFHMYDAINPSTGLPMAGGSGIDVGGTPWGAPPLNPWSSSGWISPGEED